MEKCKCADPLNNAPKAKYCEKCMKSRTTTSSFKRCRFCMSDFSANLPGDACPKCQELYERHGSPQPCKICALVSAFSNSSHCLRCQHYQKRHGPPVVCQHCKRRTAFYKDEESRRKVENAVLCFLCTYNYKLRRARERTKQQRSTKSHSDTKRPQSHDGKETAPVPMEVAATAPGDSAIARLTGSNTLITSRGSSSNLTAMDNGSSTDTTMTILRLTEVNKETRRKLEQKEMEYQMKMKEVEDLRVATEEMRSVNKKFVDELQAQLENERNNFRTQMEKLKEENRNLQGLVKKGDSSVKIQ